MFVPTSFHRHILLNYYSCNQTRWKLYKKSTINTLRLKIIFVIINKKKIIVLNPSSGRTEDISQIQPVYDTRETEIQKKLHGKRQRLTVEIVENSDGGDYNQFSDPERETILRKCNSQTRTPALCSEYPTLKTYTEHMMDEVISVDRLYF